MAIRFTSDAACLDTTLPIAERDPIFEGTSGGLWVLDTASRAGFPWQQAPRNGETLIDLRNSVGYGNGAVTLHNAQTLGYSGGMVDFAALTRAGSYLAGPASVMAAIWGLSGTGATATAVLDGGVADVTVTAGGTGYVQGLATAILTGAGQAWPVSVLCTVTAGVVTAIPSPVEEFTGAPTVVIVPSPQHFLWCGYYKLPLLADWNDSSAVDGVMPLFSCIGTESGQGTTPDFLTVGLSTAGNIIYLRKTSPAPGYTNRNLNPAVGSPAYGKVVQLAFWRTAAGISTHSRVLEAGAASVRTTRATGEHANPENFASLTPKWGMPATGITTLSGAKLNARKYKCGRGFIEALNVTGRTPADVVDADWARTLARGVFS